MNNFKKFCHETDQPFVSFVRSLYFMNTKNAYGPNIFIDAKLIRVFVRDLPKSKSLEF